MEVTMKSTKAELFEAYNKVKTQLDAQVAMKDDPVAKQKEAAKTKVLETAEQVSGLDILNPTIVEQYKNLCEAIEMKKTELEELYGIQKEANSMVALINAHKDKAKELTDKYAVLTAEAVKTLEDKKAALNEEIKELEANKKAVLTATAEENKQLRKELEKERKRNEEEYSYNLTRSRKVENDKWTDEKVAREKVLAAKEADVTARAIAVAEKEDYIAELEAAKAATPDAVKMAFDEGVKKGKADADKSHAFETRHLNTKHEYETNSLNDKIERLTSALEDEKKHAASLQVKLDEAYKQMRELASETVKSTGGVKILNHEATGK